MNDVYADWAESLQGLTLAAINHGIEVSTNDPHPPSKGEFLNHCKTYRPQNIVLQLESKLTAEQKALNQKRISDMINELARRKSV